MSASQAIQQLAVLQLEPRLTGRGRVVGQGGYAGEQLVASVRELGGRAAPVGEVIGEGAQERGHKLSVIAVNGINNEYTQGYDVDNR